MDRHVLAEIALRYDTIMSRAMLSALGLTRAVASVARVRTGYRVSTDGLKFGD